MEHISKNRGYALKRESYVLYSCFGSEIIRHKGIRIFYTPENIAPDFNICDYAIGFEHLEFGDRYIRFPYYLCNNDEVLEAQEKHKYISTSTIKQKNKFCNFIVSNEERADPFRVNFFKALHSVKHVESGGKFLNNIGKPVEDKIGFQKQCKFSLAFENSSMDGYTTEKIIHAFQAHTIPIYWGDPSIATKGGFNPKAFINIHDFSSIEKAIEFILAVDNDDDLYMSILKEPVFTDPQHVQKAQSRMHNFMKHIFTQPIEKARRRSESYCANNQAIRIEKALKQYKMIKNITHKPTQYIKQCLHFFKKMFSAN